jgi:hypothetical protein
MKTSRRQAAINQMVYWDREITLLMNKTLRWRTVSPFFRVISNLGNGKILVCVDGDPAIASRSIRNQSVHCIWD